MLVLSFPNLLTNTRKDQGAWGDKAKCFQGYVNGDGLVIVKSELVGDAMSHGCLH